MDFTQYADDAVALVNADLRNAAALAHHLADRPWLAQRCRPGDCVSLRVLQEQLGVIVDLSAAGDGPAVVAALNELLAEHPIRPRISGHDASSWHLHVEREGAPVDEVLAAEALLGLTLLVTELGTNRMGRCAADGCSRAFLDTTTNRSRRFCSTQCATRTNVARFRARRVAAG